MKRWLGQSGLSFIEVLIVLGIAGILVTGTIGLSSYVFKLRQSIAMSDEVHLRHGEIRAYLSDAGNCARSFAGQLPAPVPTAVMALQAATGNPLDDIPDFRVTANPIRGVMITRFQLGNYFGDNGVPGNWGVPNIGRIPLSIQYTQQGEVIGLPNVTMNIVLSVLVNPAVGNAIVLCRAMSSLNSDTWVGMANSTSAPISTWDSYYRLGFVGIGIGGGGRPQAFLDVNGTSRIAGNFHLDTPQPFAAVPADLFLNGGTIATPIILNNIQLLPIHSIAAFGTSCPPLSCDPYLTFSDRRLKKNISSYDFNFLEFLKLRPASFRFRDLNRKSIGLIAQDVRKVYPDLVKETRGGILTVDYGPFIVLSLEAIKNLDGRRKGLIAKINRLDQAQLRILKSICAKAINRNKRECQAYR